MSPYRFWTSRQPLLGRNPRRPVRDALLRRLQLEVLEDRTAPAATLFVDFGDAFPGGTLAMTVGQLRANLGAGIQGPDLTVAPYNVPAATVLNMTRNPALAAGQPLRNTILGLIVSYYEPLNVNFVIAASPNLATIQNALAVAGAGNDNYVIVADVIRTDTMQSVGAQFNLLGIAAAPDIIAGANNRDDSALVFSDQVIAQVGAVDRDTAFAAVIAHEAGHNFGLRHVDPGTPPMPPVGPSDDYLLARTEIMNKGVDDFDLRNLVNFTAYPLNTLNEMGLPAPTPYSPFERMLFDPNVGPRPGFPDYVTGTGAHDRITLTRVGGLVRVDVEAFRTPLRQPMDAIRVPVAGGGGPFVYTYFLNPVNGILIDAGAGDDQVVVDATVNINVFLRGMAGDDQLLLVSNGVPNGDYTPGLEAPVGADGRPSYNGTVRAGGTTVQFIEFEPAGAVIAANFANFTLIASAGNDVLNIGAPAALVQVVSGTVSGLPMVPLFFAAPAGSTLTVNMGQGNDVVNVLGTALGLTTVINLSPGVNTVTVGGPVAGLFDVLGPLFVNGGGGPTEAIFNDQANPFNTTYTITNFTVSRPGWLMTYFGLTALTFNGGSGNNVYNVLSTALITVTTINAGPNIDRVALGGPVAGLFDILGPIIVNGGGGPSELVFNDQANPFNTTYTITATTVSRPGWLFTYANVASLVFNGGSGNNIYNVFSTALLTVTTINAGPGADRVALGGPVAGLFDVLGPIFVNGGAGPAQLVFNDQVNPFNTTYTITATTVARPGWLFTYFGVASLVFNGGFGNNVYNILSTAPGTLTSVNAGPGADEFNLGSLAFGLSSLLGPFTVNAGAGPVIVNLDDRAFPDTVYTVTASTLSRPGFLLTYFNVQVMNLFINVPDVVDVLSLPPGMAFNVFRS